MESKITICWKHTLKKTEIRAGIDRVACGLGAEWGAKTIWQGDTAHFKCQSGIAKGVSGCIEASAGMLRMVIELPLCIRPFAQKIREGVTKHLKEQIGGGPC